MKKNTTIFIGLGVLAVILVAGVSLGTQGGLFSGSLSIYKKPVLTKDTTPISVTFNATCPQILGTQQVVGNCKLVSSTDPTTSLTATQTNIPVENTGIYAIGQILELRSGEIVSVTSVNTSGKYLVVKRDGPAKSVIVHSGIWRWEQ